MAEIRATIRLHRAGARQADGLGSSYEQELAPPVMFNSGGWPSETSLPAPALEWVRALCFPAQLQFASGNLAALCLNITSFTRRAGSLPASPASFHFQTEKLISRPSP